MLGCCRVDTNFPVPQCHQEQPSLPQSGPPQNSQSVPQREENFVTSSYNILDQTGEKGKDPWSRRWQRPHLSPSRHGAVHAGKGQGKAIALIT